MEFDVRSLFGELRVGHLRGALGDRIFDLDHVDVSVLNPDTIAPVSSRICLGVSRAGRAEHVLMYCPACGRPARVLRTRGDRLCCGGCGRHVTRQQNEASTLWWRIYDGRRTDEVLRLLHRRRSCHSAEFLRARRLVMDIVEADLNRVDVLQEVVEDAILLGDACR